MKTNRFKFNTIFIQLTIIFLTISILSINIMAFFSYSNFKDELLKVSSNNLTIITKQTSARMYKIIIDSINSYNLDNVEDDMIFMMAFTEIMDEFRTVEDEIINRLDFEGNLYFINSEGDLMMEDKKYENIKDFGETNLIDEIFDAEFLNQQIKKLRFDESGLDRIGESGIINFDKNNLEYIGAYNKIRGTNWIIFVDGLKEDIIKPAEKIKTAIIIFNLIFSTIIILIVLFISNYISVEINKIIKFANEIANGNFNLKSLETKTNNEIKDLISFLNKMKNKLKEKVDNMNRLLDNVGQGFLSFDENLIIDKEYSKKCLEMFGFDISNLTFLEILHMGNRKSDNKELNTKILKEIFKEMENENFDLKQSLKLLTNEIKIEEKIIEIEYKVSKDHKKIIAILTDVTEKKHFEIKAIKDELTGLFNHSYFQEIVSKEIKRSKRYKTDLSLLMLDIDNFKNFNDTYGHQTGDAVLRKLGKVLNENRRSSDVIARYGGEEFIIILPETDEKGAKIVADRTNKLIRDMVVNYENKKLKVTVSIGGSKYKTKEDKRSFIERVDENLYKAKGEGKDRNFVN